MTKTKSNAANVAKLGFWERNKRSNEIGRASCRERV